MAEWIRGRVKARRQWSDSLFSLVVEAEVAPFKAGQFTKLALETEEKKVARAYSYVNAPGQDPEFYLVTIPEGQLTPHLAGLAAGDEVLVQRQAAGFLTLDEVPPGRDLWLIATGTGVGPFVSILAEGACWERFEHIVLVHGVRFTDELGYRERILALTNDRAGFHYVPFVSREAAAGAEPGRITQAIADGRLEARVGLSFSPEHSRIMLCGNPQMVRDSIQELKRRGLEKHLRRRPGQILMENYW
ncbi:ferredoxin--NADP(+) reductase [Zobellella denitrificans]|jgi:ferredoxin/flavodoxin---NADP+ reductase|uniref:ferredoxin--NADP(+) reductase n=1 Tax=Zobellella denitrificans TaxID=347534 RepID=A0A231MVZ5_9GAMM|nr:ferredoxin--NADP reductase [Zobellella denitrificans]ATG72927.1 ferredoxin-NADP reductase [Zobellella denitrificans]OXS14135.1 ferredoxin--NADP(+) reductase [Zobellella denitrificans]